MKILFPTDFSPFSKKALEFACPIAKTTKSELIVFYSIHVPGSTISMMNEMMNILENEAHEDLKAIISEIEENYDNIELSGTTGVGDPVLAIKEYAQKTSCNLIVMGTKGATGLKKALIGSNAAGVIDNLKTPTMLIPEDAQFTGLNNIIYATDLQDIDNELEQIIELTKPWNPEITVLHVIPENLKIEEINEAETGSELVRKHHYKKLRFKLLTGTDPNAEIEYYIKETGEKDLLVMFAEKRSLLARIWDKSLSKKMAFHAELPLLVFPKK